LSTKVKASLSIFMMSITFFLMIDTKYINALGDYILQFFNINAWSGNNTGFHLTILYFGILFFISMFLVNRYAIDKLNMKGKRVFIVFVILVTSFTLVTSLSVQYIKRNSEGLESIAFDSENSELDYQFANGEIANLEVSFILKNYSEQKKEFYVSIDSPWLRKDEVKAIEILNKDGSKAKFLLEAGESKEYTITNKEFKISGGRRFANGGSRGIIIEIILSNNEGEIVRLTDENIFSVVISK